MDPKHAPKSAAKPTPQPAPRPQHAPSAAPAPKGANRADMQIDSQLRKQEAATPIDTTPPATIAPNDPEGRQPGNPDDKIELPKDMLRPVVAKSGMAMSDAPISSDDLIRNVASAAADDAVKPGEDGEVRPVSEKTRMELEAGARRTNEASNAPSAADLQAHEDKVHDEKMRAQQRAASPEEVNAAFGAKAEPVPPAPRMSQQTMDELAAGRRLVEAREADYARARELTARSNANKIHEKTASPDDLSYSSPQK